MKDDKFEQIIKGILDAIRQFPEGANIDEIRLAYDSEINLRTLQRRLKILATEGLITITGHARATVYKLASKNVEAKSVVKLLEPAIPLSEEGSQVRALVTALIQRREPVGYQRSFLESYRPNIDSYLTEAEKAQLAAIGHTGIDQSAGTYAQQILNRLLIDLSWNSSRLEGNTYSLLDTERLIDQGTADETKSAKEAQMILNHKDAIEFIVQAAEDTGFNRYTILNLHAMLASNLLPDPHAPGRLRSMVIGISGSVFTPLAIPQLISEHFDLILEKAEQIKDPFEQSFFMMVHLPYLQPFDDVNKRVSRLSANISFVKHNLSPLSFIDVPNDLYTQGMLAVYEQNNVSLLKDVFLWAYERSASRYAVIRQSLGEPDPFKLIYRKQIKEIISKIIADALTSKDASGLIREWSAELSEVDQPLFIQAVETEILALHEGNFARYRVSPKEFGRWKSAWQK
ncbi:MAG: Fic family protein [Sphingobacteriaceae bacterium]|nr:MAG: Fic family protein [Sphingobacteriaceae bacterium]